MANDVNINIVSKDKASGPIRKAGRSVKQLGKDAAKAGKQAKQDWGGLGDLFTGLLPRGLQSTLRGFKGAQRQIGRLSKSFKVLKGAIAATGLGLLVVALGEIVQNWDKISGAITSATDETEKQVELAKEQVDLAKENLDVISETENILRLQGATEEDLLEMRMAATDEQIAAQKIQIGALRQQKEEQAAAAQSASDMVAGILMLVTAPLAAALSTVDMISEGLVQIGALDEATNLAGGLYEGIGDLLFDPDGVEESGTKAIDEAEAQLTKLENTRAGYQLRKNKNEEQAEQEAQRERDKAADKERADAEFRAQQMQKLERDMELRAIEDAEARELRKREMQYEDDKAALEARGATLEELAVLEEQYDMDRADVRKRFAEQRQAEEQKEAEARQALEDELFQATLSDYDRELMQLQQVYDRRVAIAGDDEGLILAAQEDFLAKKKALDDKAAENEEQNLKDQAAMREDVARNTFDLLVNMNALFTKESEKDSKKSFQRTKALSISETLISTYLAAQKAYESQFKPTSDLSSPIRGGIAAAVTVAAGLAKVKAIKNQKYNGGNSAGSASGGGARRGGFGPTPQQLPMPARLSSPDAMQAFVVQTQLQGQMNSAQKLQSQTVL